MATAPGIKRIKMLLPVPIPPVAVANFADQVPAHLKRPDISIEFFGTRNGGSVLDSAYEATIGDAMVLDAGARAEAEGFAAVCINTMSDSGLNALRSRLTIPVVGTGQAAFHTAAMLGKRFSVITMWPQWFWIYEKLGKETGLAERLASVRSIDVRPDTSELLAGKEEIVFDKLERACRQAIDEDGAEVLMLGSTTMHQSHAYLQGRLEVPILNPGLVALKFCENLLDLGLAHSKKAWPSPETISDQVLGSVTGLF